MAEHPRDEPHTCVRDGVPLNLEWWACNSGALYGPCEDGGCGGVCELKGDCPCPCHRPVYVGEHGPELVTLPEPTRIHERPTDD